MKTFPLPSKPFRETPVEPVVVAKPVVFGKRNAK